MLEKLFYTNLVSKSTHQVINIFFNKCWGMFVGNDIHSNCEAGIDIRKNADPIVQVS